MEAIGLSNGAYEVEFSGVGELDVEWISKQLPLSMNGSTLSSSLDALSTWDVGYCTQIAVFKKKPDAPTPGLIPAPAPTPIGLEQQTPPCAHAHAGAQLVHAGADGTETEIADASQTEMAGASQAEVTSAQTTHSCDSSPSSRDSGILSAALEPEHSLHPPFLLVHCETHCTHAENMGGKKKKGVHPLLFLPSHIF